MKISELIRELNIIQELHGDVDVQIDTSGEYGQCDVQEVTLDSDTAVVSAG